MKRLLMIVLMMGSAFMFSAVTARADTSCAVAVSGGTAHPSGCPSGALIATYKYRDGATLAGGFANSMPQTLFDSGSESAQLPLCGPWQADVFTGDVLPVIDATHQYSTDGRLLAHLEGDAGTCEVEGSSTTTASTSTTTTTVAVVPSSTIAPKQLARTGQNNSHLASIAGVFLMAGGIFILAGLKASREAS